MTTSSNAQTHGIVATHPNNTLQFSPPSVRHCTATRNLLLIHDTSVHQDKHSRQRRLSAPQLRETFRTNSNVTDAPYYGIDDTTGPTP